MNFCKLVVKKKLGNEKKKIGILPSIFKLKILYVFIYEEILQLGNFFSENETKTKKNKQTNMKPFCDF
jgi:hypothetical protein